MLSIATSMREFGKTSSVPRHVNASEKPAIGVIGVGWVGLVTARLLRRARPSGGRDGHRRGEGRGAALRRRRCRSTSPGCRSWSSATASGSPSRPRWPRCSSRARLLFCCVDTPPTYSGDADLSRVEAVVAALPDGGEHALVMKSTVPAGTGAAIRRSHARPRLRLLPEFLKEGSAVERLPRTRPGRDRRRPGRRVGGRRGRRGLRAARRRAGPHRRRLGRDDQARLERLPGDQDLVHQRDRQRLRGGRRRRQRGRPRHGPRRAHRAARSCRRGSATAAPASPRTSRR